ncbi:MAG: FHA domain-containing protein [Deltaproteobacteria bacterium]|nr:FHA domain-containing protein [Deltaproteobacteria bacterium]
MPESRLLSDFVSYAHELEEDAFRSAFGNAFFILADGLKFHPPEGFQPTARIDLAALRAVTAGAPIPETPVFLVKRAEDSAFPFVSVGRTNNCDIMLPDESVSKLHAILKEIDGVIYIQDADSQNGTSLGGAEAPIRGQGKAPGLVSGSEVLFGAVRMHFVDAAGLRSRAALLPKSVATL